MAAVAAGSLVLFSVLAQHATIAPPPGTSMVPRSPEAGERAPSLTLPAPVGTPAENGRSARVPTAAFLPTDPSTTAPAPGADDPQVESPGRTSLLAGFELDIRLARTVDFEGPDAVITPSNGERPPREEPPEEDDDCPGAVDKERTPGEHPHGGPPACGNPHGAPPGYDRTRSSGTGASGSDRGSSPGNGSAPDHPSPPSSPPGKEAPPEETPRPDTGDGDEPAPPNDHPEHPQGAPPGQTKSDGGGTEEKGNPHGEPPGQSKKG